MTGHEKQQLNRCVHVFLAKSWQGPPAENDELAVEIENKMSLLRLHDQPDNQECNEESLLDKMHLYIELAILYLGKFRRGLR